MKHLYTLKVLLATLLLTIGNIAMADDFISVDSINYSILFENDLTCELTRYGKLDSNVVIPEKITIDGKTYSVTTISDSAFISNNNITNITIPYGVTTIGKSAFSYCSGLTDITIPNSVTSIGDRAFYKCSSLKSITIPNSVRSIGGYAFAKAESLDTVIISSDTISIGSSAFGSCDNIKAVYIVSENMPQFFATASNRPFLSGTGRKPEPRGTLYVPIGTKNDYYANITRDFVDVVEMDMSELRKTTEISSVIEDKDAVISVIDNNIAVYGIKSGTSINIYTVDGCLLQSTVANGEETTIVFDSTIKGVVVVQIGAKAYKVKL